MSSSTIGDIVISYANFPAFLRYQLQFQRDVLTAHQAESRESPGRLTNMSSNPLCVWSPDSDSSPLAELKQHLILYLDSPPGPATARSVYELYLRTWGDRFQIYAPTSFGSLPRKWTAKTRRNFESNEIPVLREFQDWGYVFTDDRRIDSWLFRFHGYKPFTEAGKSSFFASSSIGGWHRSSCFGSLRDVLELVQCVSGNAGYMFQGQPAGPYARSSFDQIYSWARRFWGVEVQDLDVTVNHMLDGYKCPSWLTIVGRRLAALSPTTIPLARSVAFASFVTTGGVILQAGQTPILGDRHRFEPLEHYVAIARALEPIQVRKHGGYGGSRWTEENTMAWLRRFTEPERFAS